MLRVVLKEGIASHTVDLWLVDTEDVSCGGKVYFAEPSKITFTEKKDSSWDWPAPWLSLQYHRAREFFQGLCDEMARMGYKPNTDRIAGELDATKSHLKREQELNNSHLKLIEMLIPEK